MPTIQAIHYATVQPIQLTVQNGQIVSLVPLALPPEAVQELPYVAPAFFDLQINGCQGHGFSSETLTLDQIRLIVQTCRQHGIGALCPTLITNSFAALHHGLTTIRQAIEQNADLAHALPAIHLEGPYISAEVGPRGAHPLRYVRPPDWDEFQRLQAAAGGRIRLLTLAPEHDNALSFIARLVDSGVVVALGHTAARPARIRDAIAAGAKLSTHLGNGCHAMLPRHDNYLWEQLAADDLWASIICDGQHLPPAVVRCLVRVKTPARLILTCDASSLAGLPPGRYHEWGSDLEILPEGKIVVTTSGFLAGSWAFTDLCIGNVMRFADVSLADAIGMATAQPRKLLGLPVPRLEVGEPADLVLFTMQMGRIQVQELISSVPAL